MSIPNNNIGCKGNGFYWKNTIKQFNTNINTQHPTPNTQYPTPNTQSSTLICGRTTCIFLQRKVEPIAIFA